MNSVTVADVRLPAMSVDAIETARSIEAHVKTLPQVEICTDHVIHAGMYARTITIPAGAALAGALIKIPTALIFNGHATVFVGDQVIELSGYHVIPASAGRKQAFLAHTDTSLTMIFATDARTVEQAEEEFTDECGSLFSRLGAPNNVTITGE